MNRSKLFLTVGLTLAAVCPASAQYARPAITAGVGTDQKLNSLIPLDLAFKDEAGRTVPLRSYFGDKPVVLDMVYYKCPSLCNITLNETVSSLRRVSLEPGKDYNIIAVSIDPSETPELAAEKKANLSTVFNRPSFNAGSHFLTGDQNSITRLAQAVGFRYRWDDKTKQFIHAAAIMVATPEGKLSRYFYGVQYAPADLRMALVGASKHVIGSPVDYVLMFCYHYDSAQGKYTLAIVNVLKLAGGLTLLLLGGLIFVLMRHDKGKAGKREWRKVQHVN